jgi:glycosyltransferase involved in cell wall biosynthesis
MFGSLGSEHEVFAIVPTNANKEFVGTLQSLHIRYWQAAMHRFERTLRPDRLAAVPVQFATLTALVRRVIREANVDLVHVANLFDLPYCSVAATLTRRPLLWLIENPERFDRVNSSVIRMCRPDAIVGTSTAIFNEATAAGLRARVTAVIGNPYDEQVFKPSPHPRQEGRPVAIGFAGVFCDRKGTLELCRAYVEMCRRMTAQGRPRPELHLAGGGTESYVQDMMTVLKNGGVQDTTRFFGNINDPKALREFYWNLELCVMLSKREGLSIALLEAMACGVPCVALSPWGDDAIEHLKTGIRLDSDEPAAVADALMPFLLDSHARRGLGDRGAEYLRTTFAPHVVSAKLGKIYESLTGPARSRS